MFYFILKHPFNTLTAEQNFYFEIVSSNVSVQIHQVYYLFLSQRVNKSVFACIFYEYIRMEFM